MVFKFNSLLLISHPAEGWCYHNMVAAFFCSMIGIFLSLLDENCFCLPIAMIFSSRTLNSLFLRHLGTMINRLISSVHYNPRHKSVEWRTALVLFNAGLLSKEQDNWEAKYVYSIWKILFFYELCWPLFDISSFTTLML